MKLIKHVTWYIDACVDLDFDFIHAKVAINLLLEQFDLLFMT